MSHTVSWIFYFLCSLTDLIAVWAASSLTPHSAQRTCLCLTERRETPATTPTAGLWRGWAPVKRSTWMSCCRTHQTSPLTSPPSQMACLTRSALSAGSRPRFPSANCAPMNTAMRLVLWMCHHVIFGGPCLHVILLSHFLSAQNVPKNNLQNQCSNNKIDWFKAVAWHCICAIVSLSSASHFSFRIRYSLGTQTAIHQKQSALMPLLETKKSGLLLRGESTRRALFRFCLEAILSHCALQKIQQ